MGARPWSKGILNETVGKLSEMTELQLGESTVQAVLEYLGCSIKSPTLQNLNRLIGAYLRHVPWESVSRIIKRHRIKATSDCPRWPEEFWREAKRYHFGGTCFESSLAFYSLLVSLGYEGYLTVNDMGESVACHAAIVILINQQKYLVDVTIPVHTAVRFDSQKITRRKTAFHDYTIRPVKDNVYHIERSRHSQRYAFKLVDVLVILSEYRSIVEDDYSQSGRFLKSLVINKIVDHRSWRFSSDDLPYKLKCFDQQGKHEIFLAPETWSWTLAKKFQLPEDKIRAAFSEIYDKHVEAPDGVNSRLNS